MIRRLVLIVSLLLASAPSVFALTDEELLNMEFFDDVTYVARLNNGDIVSGPVVEYGDDDKGAWVRIKATIGRAKIYASEIARIASKDDSYRHRHRGYILPTAQPIRNDHFVALIEGVLPYFGFGIGEWFSMTGGRTLVPGVGWENQFSVINMKFTLHKDDNGLIEEGESYYALGLNGAWLNDVNFMGHIFGSATFTGKRTQATLMMFAKVAGDETYTVSGGSLFNAFNFTMTNGTFGVGIGLDTRFPEQRNLHFIGELWNADLTKPTNTAMYLGLRLTSSAVAMDTGLTIVPGPAVIPTVAFAWTPF